jgi:hypothetical protein
MSSRKVLMGATVLVAVLLVVALAGFTRAQARLKGYPDRESVAAGLTDRFAAIRGEAETLGLVVDQDEVEATRENLGKAVTGFDQALEALAHGGVAPDNTELTAMADDPAAASLEEALTVWHDLEPSLAELAGDHFEAHSPAGREVLALLAVKRPHLEEPLHAAVTAIEQRAASGRKFLYASVLVSAVLGSTLLVLGGALSLSLRGQLSGLKRPRFARKAKVAPPEPTVAETSRIKTRATQPEPEAAPVVRRVEPAPPAVHYPAPSAPTPAPRPTFAPTMDLDLASATVDKVVVDMATIAGTTAKLQAAIEAVASAMQGMLFSLTEMAQDTGEGVRITRTANNAATYSAEAARELVASAREMAQIVGRVQQMARQSQDVARQVEADSAQTGATGQAFTTVVAGEVRKLALATQTATQQIEATVAEVLASQRQYEDAVGQVIRNVSAIHRVCAHLGELMLDPPARVQPGAPMPPPPAPAVAVAVAPRPTAPPPQAPVEVRVEEELSLDPFVAAPEPTPEPEVAPAPAPAPVAAVTPSPSPSVEAPQKPAGSNANVFILNRKAKPEAAAAPTPEPPAAVDEPVTTKAEEAQEAQEATEPEPVLVGTGGEELAEKKETRVGQGASGNIFMLNKKKK